MQPTCTKFLLFTCLMVFHITGSADTQLRLMTFNVWGAGANTGQPVDETLAVLRAANADILGLQETRAESEVCEPDNCTGKGPSAAPELARALGFHHYVQPEPSGTNWYNAILSRYPIIEVMPSGMGVVIDRNGQHILAINLHNYDYPYQPYQLAGVSGYSDLPPLTTATQAIESANKVRGGQWEKALSDINFYPGEALVIVFGDFNEPSHRDWTEAAAAAGRHPLAVAWPFTQALEAAGFIDTFRQAHPDAMTKPGYTWTPTTAPSDPNDHHDRIDYVFVRGQGVAVTEAMVVGEKQPEADLVVTPWPSDHRAVLVEIKLP
jgi:endonuclease/exonuclease/phosphatase family metal-dependent hydrolase